ncbi:Ser/Thr kinase [Sea otter poxvirus]|uniref:Serine/threonine-protein kinase n=1 Tax=Sea otter poxvirus TaxID=1416741 RepID=A0A2U9QHI1_9POXV|nr:Ser/Thr kinase [Sea otter poxvirus]AWU47059.1 Ser/Thr kinase [Sea otter poxvirus]
MNSDTDLDSTTWIRDSYSRDTTVLGDDIYLNYIISQVDVNQSWAPPIRLVRYFRNFSKDSLYRIAEGDYVNPSYFQIKDTRFLALNDGLYHVATGGYGIVFRLDEYIVKFVFVTKNDIIPTEYASEYTIPRFLYNNLKGDEKAFVVCALSMGLNYQIRFLHSLYRRVLNMLLLLFKVMDGKEPTLDFSPKKFLQQFNEKKNDIKFVKLISHFYTTIVQSNINLINHFGHLVHFFEHEKRACFEYDKGNIIVFPLARCSADQITKDNVSDFGFKSIILYVKFLFLQVSLFYIKVYELPGCDNFIHADLKPDNILIFDAKKDIRIFVGKKTYFFNEPITCAINDFDFSQVCQIKNKKIKGSIKEPQNWFYDFHFFVHTLLRAYPDIYTDKVFSSALEEFIMCCTKTTCEKYRLKIPITHSISFLKKFISRDIFSDWINGYN